MRYMKSGTFHLALAKFFSICAQTPSLMFLSEAAFPEILRERIRELSQEYKYNNVLDKKSFVGFTNHI